MILLEAFRHATAIPCRFYTAEWVANSILLLPIEIGVFGHARPCVQLLYARQIRREQCGGVNIRKYIQAVIDGVYYVPYIYPTATAACVYPLSPALSAIAPCNALPPTSLSASRRERGLKASKRHQSVFGEVACASAAPMMALNTMAIAGIWRLKSTKLCIATSTVAAVPVAGYNQSRRR